MTRKALIVPVIMLLMACGKDKPSFPSPSKVSLIAPDKNAVCTTGTVLSNTQSSVTFSWNTSANTDSYELDIKNLLTGDMLTQVSSAGQLQVTLLRNTPYAWYVVSRSSKTSSTAQSDTWKFYNSGPGVVSYAPYPAEISSPAFGEAVTATDGKINLSWTGSDADNDIAAYAVYFGTSNEPPLLQTNITNMFLNNVSVTSGNNYYWKVITTDSKGNTSDSGLYQFSVK